jgi:hypothetical protein
MKTIAVWYDHKNTVEKTDVELDLHINFWKLRNRQSKKQEYFLDLGFMVSNIDQVSKFHIHFPFDIGQNEIEDIGIKLHNHHDLINSVFNEYYQVKDGTTPKQHSVLNNQNETQFIIYAIDFTNGLRDFCLETNKYGGSMLSIDVDSITLQKDSKKYYFRFRIKGNELLTLMKKQAPKNWFFQSAFTATETIDFRINEKRNYQSSLLEEVSKKNEFKIKKIHFLLLRNSNEDFSSQHINATCRELEPKLWKKYVGDSFELENIIAYHWSDKRKGDDYIESFNTLVKMKYHKSNFKTIILYLVILGTLSISFNIISTGLHHLLFPGTNKDLERSIEVQEKINPPIAKEKSAIKINEKVVPSKEKETT